MMYARITKKEQLKNIPNAWEKTSNMCTWLSDRAYKAKQDYTYQPHWGRSMFGGGVEYQFTLIKWAGKREVLIETTDPQHAELILTMLISIEEDACRDRGVRT